MHTLAGMSKTERALDEGIDALDDALDATVDIDDHDHDGAVDDEYEEVEYDPPKKILERLETLERKIADDLKDLRKALG